MMKKVIRALGTLGLACAIFSASLPQMGCARFTDTLIAEEEPIPVEFNIDEDSFGEFSRREKLDQLRHWLLLTSLSAAGLPPERIGELTFDRPALGRRDLRPLGNLEYGMARSVQMNETDVLALIPADKSEAEQADLLAQIADEQLKNSGNTPERLLVFEYKINLPHRTAELTRRADVKAQEIFSPAYGYTEATVASLADFTQFMGEIDEVTSGRLIADGGIILAGRKYEAREQRGLRVEDVAALWQSEAKIAQREQSHDALTRRFEEFYTRWEQTATDFDSRWASSMTHPISTATAEEYRRERARLEDRLKREEAQLRAAIDTEKQLPRLVKGSGFSLDPAYKYDELLRYFDTSLVPKLRQMGFDRQGGFTPQEVNAARQGLVARDADPLMRLLGSLMASGNASLASETHEELRDKYSFQQARYDGDLQGTEVGMILFYTDLLAKLWAIDYHHESTPSAAVPGFRPLTNIPVAQAFKKELLELTNTRLWFGPQENGFQVSADGQALFLGPKATRVYSASSNPFKPGIETAAAVNSAAFLEWWDDYYEEIARHEPQYERLDEVMKWSLLIRWLNDAGKGDLLGFLSDVPVERTNWFPDWVRQHPELKFQQWDEVSFFERGFKGSQTEAMPLLFSKPFYQFGETRSISGGVSLARKGAIRERIAQVRDIKVRPEMRRPSLTNARTGDDLNPVSLQTKEGITYNFAESAPGRQTVIINSKPDVRLRSTSGEFGNVPVRQTFHAEAEGFKVEVGMGEVPVGRLNVERGRNAFKVGWEGRDADAGQALARRLSHHSKPNELLALDPRVEVAYQLGDGETFLIKMTNSERWMKVTPGGGGNLPPPGGSLKVAFGDPDPSGKSRGFMLGWIDSKGAQQELSAAGRNLKIQPVERAVLGENNYAQGIGIQAHADAPPSGLTPVTIRSEGQVVRAKIDPHTGTLYVSRADLPPELAGDPAWVGKQLKPADIQQISRSAKSSPTGVEYDVALRTGGNTLVEEASRAHRLIESGHLREAKQLLSELIETNENVSELKVLRAIVRVRQGKLQGATDELGALAAATRENRVAFLDEVNSRLRELCGTDIQFAHNGRTYELRQAINSREARAVSGIEATSSEADVYVMDSFAFSDADWSPANFTNTVNELVSGGRGRGVRLPPGDARNFRPSVIYDNGGGGGGRYLLRGHIRYDTPTPSQPLRVRPFLPVIACAGDDEDEDEDDRTDCEELLRSRPILLISDERGASAPQ